MNSELILSNLKKHINLNREETNYFLSLLKEDHLLRNEILVRQGGPCKNIYFVTSGILRAFYLNYQGKDSTVMFAVKDWWITDMYPFLNELPAMVNIQAVDECTILKLSKNNLDLLYREIPKFNTLFRILMQNAYCREQLRIIENLSSPASERYNQFLMKYPQIARRVTQKQIASYLGITPEFLSSIRAKR